MELQYVINHLQLYRHKISLAYLWQKVSNNNNQTTYTHTHKIYLKTNPPSTPPSNIVAACSTKASPGAKVSCDLKAIKSDRLWFSPKKYMLCTYQPWEIWCSIYIYKQTIYDPATDAKYLCWFQYRMGFPCQIIPKSSRIGWRWI